jgi:hypothetical protein
MRFAVMILIKTANASYKRAALLAPRGSERETFDQARLLGAIDFSSLFGLLEFPTHCCYASKGYK